MVSAPSTNPDETSQHFLFNGSDWQHLTQGFSNSVEPPSAYLREIISQGPSAQRQTLSEANTVTKMEKNKASCFCASVTDGEAHSPESSR